MKSIKLISLASLAFVLFSGCTGNKNEEKAKTSVTDISILKDTSPVKVNQETKSDFSFANIPFPVNMMKEVSKWQEPYDNTLFNTIEKSKDYSGEFSKAINLGIYNTDMSYAIIKNKGEDVLMYLKAVLVLSDQLGLKSTVDQLVGKRAENNLGNKDSLLKIQNEICLKSDSYLRSNKRVFTSSSVFAGSWIESLYLSCKIGENTTDRGVRGKAYKCLWDQRFHLSNLTGVLSDFSDNAEASELNDELKIIHREIKFIKDPEHLDDKTFILISSRISNLRNKYTGRQRILKEHF